MMLRNMLKICLVILKFKITKITYVGQQLGQSINLHRNMLEICLVFSKSEPQYAYKRYVYKGKAMYLE